MNLYVFSDKKEYVHISRENADYSGCGANARRYDEQKFIDETELHSTLDRFSERGKTLCSTCLREFE